MPFSSVPGVRNSVQSLEPCRALGSAVLSPRSSPTLELGLLHHVPESPPCPLRGVLDSILVDSPPLLFIVIYLFVFVLGNSLVKWSIPDSDSRTSPYLPPRPCPSPLHSAVSGRLCPTCSSALFQALGIPRVRGGFFPRSQSAFILDCPILNPFLPTCQVHGSRPARNPAPTPCLPLLGTPSPTHTYSSLLLLFGHSCWRINLGC